MLPGKWFNAAQKLLLCEIGILIAKNDYSDE